MRPAQIICNGVLVEAWPDGTLFCPVLRLLAVADLHLEKGSAYAAGAGRFLPPYDTRETLRILQAAIERHAPKLVLCLGDSTHDAGAVARIDSQDLACVQRLTAATRWIWIAGNHDPAPPPEWGGEICEEHEADRIVFRHQAVFGAAEGEISGHYHPVAAVSVRGRGLRRRCFVTDGQRLILPSFGAFTGGLNALDPAIAQLFPGDYDVLALGRGTLHRLSWRQLRPDWTSIAESRAG